MTCDRLRRQAEGVLCRQIELAMVADGEVIDRDQSAEKCERINRGIGAVAGGASTSHRAD